VEDAEPIKHKKNHEKNKPQINRKCKAELDAAAICRKVLESPNQVSTSKHKKVICAKEKRKSTKENLSS
jgi:hypothetical protein